MSLKRKVHNLFFPKVGEVWMLHRVVETSGQELRYRRLEVERQWLAAKLDQLIDAGTRFCSIDEVMQKVEARRRFVCLTFDDAYLDTLTEAYPLLVERKLPFCVYATRDFYRGTARPQWMPDVPMMDATLLRLLSSDSLCTIGAHTCSHPHLSRLSREEQMRELSDCKADLEQLLGRPVSHMAYPHGDFSLTTLELCSEVGFSTAVAANGCPVRTDANPMCIDRVTISQF